MRTAFFIDGYNLFYGLLAGTPFKWLDLPALLTYITKIQNPASETAQVNYFTSPVLPPLATRGKESAEAQDVYIRALKAKGVTVHLGRHRLNRGSAPRYLDGIPDDSRIARGGHLKKEALTEDVLRKIRDLNEIAARRGQTLAEMSLAWLLKDEKVTSVIIGASSVKQIDDNLKSLDNRSFCDEEIYLINNVLSR